MEFVKSVCAAIWFLSVIAVCSSMAFCAVWAFVTKTKSWIVGGVASGVIGINLNVIVQFLAFFVPLPSVVHKNLADVVPFLSMIFIAYFVGFLMLLIGSKRFKSIRTIGISVIWAILVVCGLLAIFGGESFRKEIVLRIVFFTSLLIEIGTLWILANIRSSPKDNWEMRELKAFVKKLFWPLFIFIPLAAIEIFLGELNPYPLGYRFTTGAAICAVLGLLYIRFFYHWVSFHVNGLTSGVMDRELPRNQLEVFGLTDRERELIELLDQGLSNIAMAERMFISPSTVKNHLYNIYQKTGVKNRIAILKLFKRV